MLNIKKKFIRFGFLLVLLILYQSHTLNGQAMDTTKTRFSAELSFGTVSHFSKKTNYLENLSYRLNYSGQVCLSFSKEKKKIKTQVFFGWYSKKYVKEISFTSHAFPDSNVLFGGEQNFQLYYYGLGISLLNDIPIAKQTTLNFCLGMSISYIPFKLTGANTTNLIYQNKEKIYLFNYLSVSNIDLCYRFNRNFKLNFKVFLFKECYKRYFEGGIIPVGFNMIKGIQPLSLPEFPIFSISPQLSFKYVLK